MHLRRDEGCALGGQEASHARCFVRDTLLPGCTLRSTRPKPFPCFSFKSCRCGVPHGAWTPVPLPSRAGGAVSGLGLVPPARGGLGCGWVILRGWGGGDALPLFTPPKPP